MNVQIVNPVNEPQWDQQLAAGEDDCFFHSAAWAEVVSRSFAYRPVYFLLAETGRPPALLPMMEVKSVATGNRGVSLSFSDYCEPHAADRETFDRLLERAIDFGRGAGWRYLELRGGERYLPDAPVAASYYGHRLELSSSAEKLLDGFRSNTRWSIKKAMASGVTTRFDNSLPAMREFYRLQCLTRMRHGVPPQPFGFFRNVHDCILARGLGNLVLASVAGSVVAGAVCFHRGNRAIYKYAASDDAYRQLGANNLVLWEAIAWYAQRGFAQFCFGRTDGDNEGLRKFKAGWSTTEQRLHYYRYDLRSGSFTGAEPGAGTRFDGYLKRVPKPVLKLIGQFFYRHAG